MKKKWYILQTMSGYEYAVKENLENKVEVTGAHHLVGKVVIPEEVVLDASSKSSDRYVLPPNVKLHVSSGKNVEKGEILAPFMDKNLQKEETARELAKKISKEA